jgi:hypothetical protein
MMTSSSFTTYLGRAGTARALERLLHVVIDLHVVGSYRLPMPSSFSTFSDAFFGERDAAVFLVDRVIAGGPFWPGLLAFDHFATLEREYAVNLAVLVGGFLAGPGNDERCAGFVNRGWSRLRRRWRRSCSRCTQSEMRNFMLSRR